MPASHAKSVFRPTPDGGGGATMSVPAGQDVVAIAGSELRAVDVVAAAPFGMLDMGDCAPGVHVRVIGGHLPSVLLAPSEGDGLVLHATLSGPPTDFLIIGVVDTVTLAWPSAVGRRELRISPRGSKRPVSGAFIGRAEQLPDHADVELVALVGGRTDVARLRKLAPRHLQLVGVDTSGVLELPFPLEALLLRRSLITGLKTHRLGYLRTERCAALRTIDADGNHATIIDTGNGERLDVLGRWDCLELRRVGARAIRVPTVSRLRIKEAGAVRSIETLSIAAPQAPIQVEVDGSQAPALSGHGALQLRPMTAVDIQAAFTRGLGASADGMVRWAQGCSDTSELWLALEVLGTSIDAGHDATEAWQSRCALHDRGHVGGWFWRFPDDLADRGWRADLLLWLRCAAARVPGALSFARVMACCERPTQVVALLRVAANGAVRTQQRALLLRIATAAMNRAMAVGMRQDRCASDREFVGLSQRDVALLQQGARALLRATKDGYAVDEALATYCQYLARCAPTLEGVHILGRLYGAGVQHARSALTAMRVGLSQRAELTADERVLLGRAVVRQLILGAGQSACSPQPAQGTNSRPQLSAAR